MAESLRCSPEMVTVLFVNQLYSNIKLKSFKPGDLPNPGIEPRSPALGVDSVLADPPGKPCDGRDMMAKCPSFSLPRATTQRCMLHSLSALPRAHLLPAIKNLP